MIDGAKQVIRAAYLEWRVTRQMSTANGEKFLASEPSTDAHPAPGWFIAEELGFGDCNGPSLLWTLEHLPETNRRHIKRFESGKDVPSDVQSFFDTTHPKPRPIRSKKRQPAKHKHGKRRHPKGGRPRKSPTA